MCNKVSTTEGFNPKPAIDCNLNFYKGLQVRNDGKKTQL